jgi:hypothetical protein
LHPENIVDDKLDPERSKLVMSTEYEVFGPTIIIVTKFETEIDSKFTVAVCVTFNVTVPGPTMVPLATEALGIVNTFPLFELYDRVYPLSVLELEKKSNPMLPLTMVLLTMGVDLV